MKVDFGISLLASILLFKPNLVILFIYKISGRLKI